jgi:hypothetical protein
MKDNKAALMAGAAVGLGAVVLGLPLWATIVAAGGAALGVKKVLA